MGNRTSYSIQNNHTGKQQYFQPAHASVYTVVLSEILDQNLRQYWKVRIKTKIRKILINLMIFLSIILSPKKSFSFTDLLARQFTVTAASLAPNPIKDILFQDIELIAERAQVPFTYGLHVVNAPDRSIKQLRKSILGICRHHPGELNYNKKARFGTLSGLVIKYIALLYTKKYDQTLFFAYHADVRSYWNQIPIHLCRVKNFPVVCKQRVMHGTVAEKLVHISNEVNSSNSPFDAYFMVNYIIQNIVDFWIILYENYGLDMSLLQCKNLRTTVKITEYKRAYAGGHVTRRSLSGRPTRSSSSSGPTYDEWLDKEAAKADKDIEERTRQRYQDYMNRTAGGKITLPPSDYD